MPCTSQTKQGVYFRQKKANQCFEFCCRSIVGFLGMDVWQSSFNKIQVRFLKTVLEALEAFNKNTYRVKSGRNRVHSNEQANIEVVKLHTCKDWWLFYPPLYIQNLSFPRQQRTIIFFVHSSLRFDYSTNTPHRLITALRESNTTVKTSNPVNKIHQNITLTPIQHTSITKPDPSTPKTIFLQSLIRKGWKLLIKKIKPQTS